MVLILHMLLLIWVLQLIILLLLLMIQILILQTLLKNQHRGHRAKYPTDAEKGPRKADKVTIKDP